MDHMIYIYAGLAFVLAGGGWFIGWHGGYRRANRDHQLERERMVVKMMLNAQFGRHPEGVILDVNSRYPSQLVQRQDANVATLSDLLDDHLRIMDADE